MKIVRLLRMILLDLCAVVAILVVCMPLPPNWIQALALGGARPGVVFTFENMNISELFHKNVDSLLAADAKSLDYNTFWRAFGRTLREVHQDNAGEDLPPEVAESLALLMACAPPNASGVGQKVLKARLAGNTATSVTPVANW